jgi:hypothetical protein
MAPFDKGKQPFQDFERLVKLRNAIMHTKPVGLNERHLGEEVTNELGLRNISLAAKSSNLAWFDRLMTPEVAQWACKSARAVILDLLNKVPVGTPDAFAMERGIYSNDAHFDSVSFV